MSPSPVRQPEVVVSVLDTKANASEWVRRELQTALAGERLILPVVQDEAALPPSVRDIPYRKETGQLLS